MKYRNGNGESSSEEEGGREDCARTELRSSCIGGCGWWMAYYYYGKVDRWWVVEEFMFLPLFLRSSVSLCSRHIFCRGGCTKFTIGTIRQSLVSLGLVRQKILGLLGWGWGLVLID